MQILHLVLVVPGGLQEWIIKSNCRKNYLIRILNKMRAIEKTYT